LKLLEALLAIFLHSNNSHTAVILLDLFKNVALTGGSIPSHLFKMPNAVPAVVWQKKEIDFFGTHVPVYLPDSISQEELENMPAFKNWKTNLHTNLALQNSSQNHPFHAHPYTLRSITVNSVTKFPNRKIGFINVDAAVERDSFPGDNDCGIPKSLPGERAQGEMITLHVTEYQELWKVGARDGKTLASWALYEALSRSGELEKYKKQTTENRDLNGSRESLMCTTMLAMRVLP
jgi:hypothetical protein